MNKNTTGFWPVAAALGGNSLVTIIKFMAALASGSAVMLSESIHSFADTLNQTLLLVGLKRSTKKPDEVFLYGYGQERFFWALISACGIFFIGAGATIYQGVNALLNPEHIVFKPIIGLVLLASFVIELFTFLVAAKDLKNKYPENSWSERIKLGDPSTLSVFFEDGLAVIGVMVAGLSLYLSYLSGNPFYDAFGSIIIGLFLGMAAIFLIMKNRGYLIGQAMPEDLQEKIIELLQADPSIEKVLDFKSAVLDIGIYRIKCEIEFNGYVLLKEIYKINSLREEYIEVKDDYEEFKKFCVDFADRIPRLVGKKIDDLETKLKNQYPGIKYIDIEIN